MTGRAPDPALVDEVIAWFDEVRRPFPWRDPDRTAWGVLVSEVMSQQTQMSRVEPKWREFVDRWPTPAAFAAASDAEAIRAWDRLGYPRRAVALRRCAEAIVAEHGGEVPADPEALLALPGIGPYTAAAVCSFAFGMPVPVVDTNVRRVLARAVHGEAIAWSPNPRRDAAEMAALLPADGERAAEWNAGAMELGALVCTARAPRCPECPIRGRCEWRGAGFPAAERTPRRQPRFEGSDRQRRGRVLAALRADPGGVELDRLAERLGLARLVPDELDAETARHRAAADSLVADGLAEREGGRIRLVGD
ncbi:MAG: A/G-specific adenine glycosylase [Microbacteriaceae bacterium]|nr:A/G-specific adenine glycosylase [Microbacteriaceae bacterium]